MLGLSSFGLFALLLIAVKVTSGPLPGDVGLELDLQRGLAGWGLRDQWGDAAFGVLSLIFPAVTVLAAIAWRRFRNAAMIAVGVLSAWLVAGLLQIAIERPRPSPAIVHVYAIDRSPGFPSVSVAGELTLACVLILLLWRAERISARRWLQVAAIATAVCLVLLGSVAEIYIGRHWPSDVVGGWLFAGAWFALLVIVYRRLPMLAVRKPRL